MADKNSGDEKVERAEENAAPEPVKSAEPAAGETKAKKSRAWIWPVAIIVLIVIAFIPYYYTASSASCGRCHSMDQYYASWKKSIHGINETPCSDCHVRPGWFATTTYRIAFYRELFAEVVGMNLSPWGATAPGEASCTRANCHSFKRLSSRSGELKVDHGRHFTKAKIECRKCHAGVTHPGVKGIGLLLPPKRQCFVCHKAQAKKCDFCHTTKYKPGTVPKTPHF